MDRQKRLEQKMAHSLETQQILHSNEILKQKKLIAFDLYGTLIYYPHSHDRLKEQLKSVGIEPLKKLYKIVQTNPIDIKSANSQIKGFKMPKIVIDTFRQHTIKNIKNTKLYPETLDILKKLGDAGYLLALISNLSQEYEKPLRDLIPRWMFDYEALSFNVGAMKPKPKIFKEIKRQSKVEWKDMLMIGDLKRLDVDGAKNVGMDAILLDRHSKEMKYSHKHDLITISTLKDLEKILDL